jgi:hypothetical protein
LRGLETGYNLWVGVALFGASFTSAAHWLRPSGALEVSVPGGRPSIEQGRTVVRLSAERLARNQALFREVNERLYELVTVPTVTLLEFICECTDPNCVMEKTVETEFMAESDPRSLSEGT